MKTLTNTTSDLRYTETRSKGKTRCTINIHLNDKCKNGHEDFSITGSTLELQNGKWREGSCGCIHDILEKFFPELSAIFVPLHLCDWEGSAMHCVSNARYHLFGTDPKGRQYARDTIRATEEELDAIVAKNPQTNDELSYILEEMGFRTRWQAEAKAATAKLEELTGKTFKSTATCQQWPKLSDEEAAVIEEREKSGFYLPENVAKREEAKRLALIAKRKTEIETEYSKKVSEAELRRKASHWLLDNGIDEGNAIFYTHTGRWCFGWRKKYSEKDRSHLLDVISEFPFLYDIEENPKQY